MSRNHTHIKIDRPMPDSVKKAMKDKSDQWAARVAAAKAKNTNTTPENVSGKAKRS